MSLLTGEPRTATVRAENDCEVLEISKAVMGELLRNSPQCLDQLSELLAKRKLETEGLVKKVAGRGEKCCERARIHRRFCGGGAHFSNYRRDSAVAHVRGSRL